MEEVRDSLGTTLQGYSGHTVDTQDTRVIQMQIIKKTHEYAYSYRTNANACTRLAFGDAYTYAGHWTKGGHIIGDAYMQVIGPR